MRRILILTVGLLCGAPPLLAQERDRLPSGVRLGLIYQTSARHKVAVRPFSAPTELARAAEEASEIVARDLDFSDRFEMVSVPSRLASGPVEYGPWNDLGLVYLISGSLEPLDGGEAMLRITLHDVVYGRTQQVQAFRLPARNAPGFRMAVHAASDQVVDWTTGQPGAAATRIAFVRPTGGGGYELMVVDSDGENLQRLEGHDDIIFSPTWSRDGRRLAYTRKEGGRWELRERDMLTGRTRVLDSRQGLILTPAYAPDGETMSFGLYINDAVQIYRYNAARQCCLQRQIGGTRDDLSPTYSPDGRRVAYMSNRLIQPHIYVASADGNRPELLSPYVYGEPGHYAAPSWAPTGSLVTFHGRSRGEHQIMVADADRPGATVRQITAEGRSEDPSWGPDARHIVFAGTRAGRQGIFVIDAVSGRVRPVVTGGSYKLPDWSPTLLRATDLVVTTRD